MSIALLERRLLSKEWCAEIKDINDHYVTDESELLGKGSFASVRKCWKRNGDTKELFASKRLRKLSFINNKTKTRQLLVEIAVTTCLSHPNLAKTKEVLLSEEHIHIIMDLYTGLPLSDYLIHYGPRIPELETSVIIEQLLSALQYLHSQRFVHRDVKPSNIIIKPLSLQTTLIDIGLGKYIGSQTATPTDVRNILFSPTDSSLEIQSPSTDSLSEPSFMMTPEAGTALYLALEGIAGKLESDFSDLEGWVTTRSKLFKLDIYSVGATAFRMLSGRLPFSTSLTSQPNIRRLKTLMTLSPICMPSDISLSKSGVDLFESMLSRDPDSRPDASGCLSSEFFIINGKKKMTEANNTVQESISGSEGAVEESWDDLMEVIREAEDCDQVVCSDSE